MIRRPVTVITGNDPHVLFRENRYELLCEYIGRPRGRTIGVYFQEGGHNAIVVHALDRAVVGVFSTDPSKIRKLFDYIEFTLLSGEGLWPYKKQSFEHFLDMANKAGGRYPRIQNELRPFKHQFLYEMYLRFHKPQVDFRLYELIQSRTAPIEYIHLPNEISPAKTLPEGWVWEEWDNYTGHLKSPDGEIYFDYDFQGDPIYQEAAQDEYTSFQGSTIPEFKEYAESVIRNRLRVIESTDRERSDEHAPTSSHSPAETLPEGWVWVSWDDGSGHLKSPDGESYFIYDRAPYANQGGIEYKRTDQDWYGPFWGTFAEFKEYAESFVRDCYLETKLEAKAPVLEAGPEPEDEWELEDDEPEPDDELEPEDELEL